jgi:hypothetical protein
LSERENGNKNQNKKKVFFRGDIHADDFYLLFTGIRFCVYKLRKVL